MSVIAGSPQGWECVCRAERRERPDEPAREKIFVADEHFLKLPTNFWAQKITFFTFIFPHSFYLNDPCEVCAKKANIQFVSFKGFQFFHLYERNQNRISADRFCAPIECFFYRTEIFLGVLGNACQQTAIPHIKR